MWSMQGACGALEYTGTEPSPQSQEPWLYMEFIYLLQWVLKKDGLFNSQFYGVNS